MELQLKMSGLAQVAPLRHRDGNGPTHTAFGVSTIMPQEALPFKANFLGVERDTFQRLHFGSCVNAETRAEAMIALLMGEDYAVAKHALASAGRPGNGTVDHANTILALLAGSQNAAQYLTGPALDEALKDPNRWDSLVKHPTHGFEIQQLALLTLVQMIQQGVGGDELKQKILEFLKKVAQETGRVRQFGHLNKELVQEAIAQIESEGKAQKSAQWRQAEDLAAEHAGHVHTGDHHHH